MKREATARTATATDVITFVVFVLLAMLVAALTAPAAHAHTARKALGAEESAVAVQQEACGTTGASLSY